MIKIHDLHKWYGTTHALKGISFEIPKGGVVGLLGPNGAGKSTMMRILTGYLSPSSGSVKVGDLEVTEEPIAVKKKIGYLPEIPPLYEEMTVQGFLTFVAELKGVAKEEREASVDHAMKTTGSLDVAHRLIGHISKGYRQRVGIAQAIVHDPEVVILDEPTIGLDPRQIIEIRNLIRSLGERHTVLLSSHILPEVSATCQQVMIIHKGEIVAVDSQEKLSERTEGVSRVKVTFKADEKQAEEILKKSGLKQYRLIERGNEVISYEVSMDKGKDLREALFFTAADKRLPILELIPEALTLEEVFLKLTREAE